MSPLEAMQQIWDAGDAMLPIDPRLPTPALERLLASLRPTALIDQTGERHDLRDGVPVRAIRMSAPVLDLSRRSDIAQVVERLGHIEPRL